MSKKLEKLLKQQETLAAEIKAAELAARNTNRIERLDVKLIRKHKVLFLSDPAAVEKALDDAITAVAVSFK